MLKGGIFLNLLRWHKLDNKRHVVQFSQKCTYNLCVLKKQGKYHAVDLSVAHDELMQLGIDGVHALGAEQYVLYDIKSVLPIDEVDARL